MTSARMRWSGTDTMCGSLWLLPFPSVLHPICWPICLEVSSTSEWIALWESNELQRRCELLQRRILGFRTIYQDISYSCSPSEADFQVTDLGGRAPSDPRYTLHQLRNSETACRVTQVVLYFQVSRPTLTGEARCAKDNRMKTQLSLPNLQAFPGAQLCRTTLTR